MENTQSKYEREGKAFISANIEYQGYDEYNYYLSGKKLLYPGIFSISYAMVLIFLMKKLPVLPTAWTVGVFVGLVVVYLLIVQKLVRMFVLDEDRLMETYTRGYGSDAGLTMSDLWNLYSFDEATRTAKLYNLVAGKLIKVKRSSIIGKGKDFKIIDQKARAEFYNQIYTNNLHVIRHNRFEGVDSTEELNKFGEKIEKADNENLKALLKVQNGYMKRETRYRSSIEVDYYFIYATSVKNYDKLSRIPEIISILSNSGGYTHIHTLDKIEFIKFSASVAKLEYPDISSLSVKSKHKMFRSNPIQPIAIFDEDMNLLKDLQEHEEDSKSRSSFKNRHKLPKKSDKKSRFIGEDIDASKDSVEKKLNKKDDKVIDKSMPSEEDDFLFDSEELYENQENNNVNTDTTVNTDSNSDSEDEEFIDLDEI